MGRCPHRAPIPGGGSPASGHRRWCRWPPGAAPAAALRWCPPACGAPGPDSDPPASIRVRRTGARTGYGRRFIHRGAPLPRTLLLLLLLPCLAGLSAAAQAAGDAAASLRQVLAAACEAPSAGLDALAARIPGATGLAEEPLVVRGAEVGRERRLALPGGAEVRLERLAPGGRLRRLVVEYRAPAAGGGTRPRLAAIADADCDIRLGRRLVYEPDSAQPVAIEHLDAGLEPTGERAPLNPPVPEGADPGGVPVALVDAGVNYLLPKIARRLVRDDTGAILGHDYWDMDARPFDANPARSPFFPQRHGTKTAALLLREAPAVALVPYRYPRPDMERMAALIEDAAADGVVVVNVSMGSGERAEWQAFADAARAHPGMLFVVSAGNNGRDIDAEPVYPAALPLENIVTVTSSTDDGRLARGSNWGREAVDLLVPAERLRVTGFDGGETLASGSSYAAVRISALAARLLAAHPDWRAAELRDAIFARVLPTFTDAPRRVAEGFLPRPDKAEALPPLSAAGEPREVARHAFAHEALNADTSPAAGYVFEPTFAYFEGTAWSPGALRRHARRMAAILGQCGITVPRIDVRVLGGPNAYRYFHERIATALVQRLRLPTPTVYFVADTLQVNAYDAEAFGKANTATRPALRYTVWFTEDTRDPGIALAHELAHVLMDSGAHVDASGNLMRADTTPSSTRLTPEQCERIIEQGTENGLLAAAPG